MDIVTLTCPSCGGKLEITGDIETFACAYCGQEHLVKRGGGVVTVQPLIASIRGVQAGLEKAAAEMALDRLAEELAGLKIEEAGILRQYNNLPSSLASYIFTAFAGLVFILGIWMSIDVGFKDGSCLFMFGLTLLGLGIFWVWRIRVKRAARKAAYLDQYEAVNHKIQECQVEIEQYEAVSRGMFGPVK